MRCFGIFIAESGNNVRISCLSSSPFRHSDSHSCKEGKLEMPFRRDITIFSTKQTLSRGSWLKEKHRVYCWLDMRSTWRTCSGRARGTRLAKARREVGGVRMAKPLYFIWWLCARPEEGAAGCRASAIHSRLGAWLALVTSGSGAGDKSRYLPLEIRRLPSGGILCVIQTSVATCLPSSPILRHPPPYRYIRPLQF